VRREPFVTILSAMIFHAARVTHTAVSGVGISMVMLEAVLWSIWSQVILLPQRLMKARSICSS